MFVQFYLFCIIVSATCKDRRAKVEYMNGTSTVKNCLYWPCTVGYFCEYNPHYNNGQYICCGTNANNIYGKKILQEIVNMTFKKRLVLFVFYSFLIKPDTEALWRKGRTSLKIGEGRTSQESTTGFGQLGMSGWNHSEPAQ